MTTNRTIIYETPSSSCSDPSSFAAERIGKTIVHCVVLVISLVGNCFIGIIVYKTRTMRKTINYFIANMAVSDLLYPISVFPPNLVQLSVDSWLIDGPLGQALCKLLPFLQYVSAAVSIQSLVLIAVDRCGAVVCPLRPPIISSKLSFFFLLSTCISALSILFPCTLVFKVVHYPENWYAKPALQIPNFIGSILLFDPFNNIKLHYFCPDDSTLHKNSLKAQSTTDSWYAVDHSRFTTPETT